eukprot:TRINITY_DN3872_c0_g1_i1.p1 TRINITY_DN3872_c0_g1~~TRINITY_DN3872_c0_g1_i1.p1  ORF type:complete len:728 (+),score=198.55 TRINITY_DN3872_c0_g1_i1:284-2467(+)
MKSRVAAAAVVQLVCCVVAASALAPAGAPSSEIEYLHVVWSNHFDAGFTDLLINVINKYFDDFFPRAVRTVEDLRYNPGMSWIYTCEAPWLISLYLDDCEHATVPGELHCPTEDAKNKFRSLIFAGNVTWPAFPFNAEPEIMDASMMGTALDLVQRLDKLLGRQSSISFSQRDVPMLTRSAIPVLAAHGVRSISVGVNSASPPTATSSPFVWRDPESGEEVIVFIHPDGYGGIERNDLVTVPGWPHALATVWRGDNDGPQYALDVVATYTELQTLYPKAQIIASTFDSFTLELEKIKDQLPVVTSEIGDTWIYGIPSDPYKLAQWGAVSRVVRDCIDAGDSECDVFTNDAFANFARVLVKVAEHTWGVDVKTYLKDTSNWSNEQFEAHRNDSNFQKMEQSWQEQRDYISNAILALGSGSPLAQKINDALAELLPAIPDPVSEGYTTVALDATLTCGDLTLSLDSQTGGITQLRNGATGRAWAASDRQLGQFIYQTFDGADFTEFLAEYFYTQPPPSWAQKDFGKPNVDNASPEHKTWNSPLAALWQKGDCSALAQLAVPTEAFSKYGAPQTVWLRINIVADTVALEYYLVNKTSTRLPEAAFVSFDADTSADTGAWYIVKSGERVDPLDIVTNGSCHLHSLDPTADWNAAYATDDGAGLYLRSLDGPLASVGVLDAFPVPLTPAESIANGVGFNLWNNLWGTNYVQWFPFAEVERAVSLFRFQVKAL